MVMKKILFLQLLIILTVFGAFALDIHKEIIQPGNPEHVATVDRKLEEIEKLSAFCGVPVKPEYASVYVNKTKNAVNNSASLEAEIRDAYSDVCWI